MADETQSNSQNQNGEATAQTTETANTAETANDPVRAELEAAQAKLRQYEAAAEADRQAKLSEAEKLKERAEKAEREAQAARIQALALKLGAEPELVAPHMLNVKAGEEEAAVTALIARYPQLKIQQAGVSVGVNAARSAEQGGVFTESQIANREFYLKYKDAILKAQREGRIVKG